MCACACVCVFARARACVRVCYDSQNSIDAAGGTAVAAALTALTALASVDIRRASTPIRRPRRLDRVPVKLRVFMHIIYNIHYKYDLFILHILYSKVYDISNQYINTYVHTHTYIYIHTHTHIIFWLPRRGGRGVCDTHTHTHTHTIAHRQSQRPRRGGRDGGGGGAHGLDGAHLGRYQARTHPKPAPAAQTACL